MKINNEKKFKTNVAYETLAPVWNQSVTVAMPTDADKLVIVSTFSVNLDLFS